MLRFLPALAGLLLLAPLARSAEPGALWKDTVQPLLDANCVKCHGPLKHKSGLELDSVEAALKGGDDGAVIKPGNPDESSLLAALVADADPHMPPKKQLAPAEIAEVRKWITELGEGGALAKREAPEPMPAEAEPTEAIDHFLEAGWHERDLAPAPACDDLVFIRRIYLDLAGRIPNPAEVAEFVTDSAATTSQPPINKSINQPINKFPPPAREHLVTHLLAGPDYPRHFREIWDALLMGRASTGKDQRRQKNGWFDFLETAFRQNRPWNEVVRAIILARPEQPEDRGAFWFLYERKDGFQLMAEALAPVIYGTRVSCAQCHDHPLAREIKQGHYWGLVAAFNRSKNTEKEHPAVAESAVGGFINFTNLRKESQPAVITLLNGRTIEETRPPDDAKTDDQPGAYVDPAAPVKVPKFSRRAALADAATSGNPLLARSFVNYTWAILMGRGIVQPMDEMNSKHPPSHPELLDWLARDFESHGYDVRRLVRSIVLSRGYQLAAASGATPPPAEGFAAAAEKPLTAETIARSAQIASGQPGDNPALRQAFADAFPDVLPRVPRATIQGAMLLANSEQLTALFAPAAGASASLLAGLPTPEERVLKAFRLALIRPPEAEELAAGVQYLQAHVSQPAEAAGHLLWALVTGPEFLTNH